MTKPKTSELQLKTSELEPKISELEPRWDTHLCVLQLQIVFTCIHIKRPEDLTRPGLWPANLYVYVYALILVIPIISMNMLWHSCLHEKKNLGWSGDRGHLHDHLLHELADGDTVSSRIQKTAEAAVKD